MGSGQIPEETIREVRERTDIVQVIGQYVELRRAGTAFVGLCPFHEESAPSFNVNPQKQFFHCFGCQESGDAIGFLMKVEGRRFVEVVEDLAGRLGLALEREQVSARELKARAQRRSDRQKALDLNMAVAELYRRTLETQEGAPGQAYLRQRGISAETARAFRIGYAPGGANLVVRHCQRNSVPLAFAERIGLVATRRGRGGYYDRFWNRLIFPVCSVGGEVLAFAGRLVGEAEAPKYINSPETFLYRKGEALFGLHAAAGPIRKRGLVLVVEGNIDVVQLYQCGFQHTVAPMGTALTPKQVGMLRRLSGEVVALFDGDRAGQAAALKAVPLLVEGQLSAKVATLPPDQDPDSLLRQHGAEAMEQVLAAAQPALDFLINSHLDQMEDSVPGRVRMLEQVAPVVARLESGVAREIYADKLAALLSVERGVVRRALRGGRVRELMRPEAPRGSPGPKTQPAVKLDQTELVLLGVLAEHPHLAPRAEHASVGELLTNPDLRATYRTAVEMQRSTGEISVAELLQATPEQVRNQVARRLTSGEFASTDDPGRTIDATKALDDCIRRLERRQMQAEERELLQQIARAEAKHDIETYQDLLVRRIEILREIQELEREIHDTR